jgi:hypothetical protein
MTQFSIFPTNHEILDHPIVVSFEYPSPPAHHFTVVHLSISSSHPEEQINALSSTFSLPLACRSRFALLTFFFFSFFLVLVLFSFDECRLL